MKLLREAIRSMILQEGMITPHELPPDIGIRVHFQFGGNRVYIHYCEIRPDGTLGASWAEQRSKSPHGIYGRMKIDKLQGAATCGGAWTVVFAEAASGYGPLLYDIALEISTMYGSGLVSDRETVSMDAHDVWQFYLDHRTGDGGDVEVFQCDDTKNTLTPDPSDNLDQEIPKMAYGYDGLDWVQHQLSKRYSKENVVYDALDKDGKLFVERD